MPSLLTRHWPPAALLAGLILLSQLAVVINILSPAVTSVYVLLPIYMLHQYEEHKGDRFRTYFNRVLGKGGEVLSPRAVFMVNVPGVWGFLLGVFLLAWKVDPAWGLFGAHLMLVNAVLHAGCAVRLRQYNPGLATAVLLFPLFGGYCVWMIQAAGHGHPAAHAGGLAMAAGLHAILIWNVRRRARARE
jgi:hypothetical protein